MAAPQTTISKPDYAYKTRPYPAPKPHEYSKHGSYHGEGHGLECDCCHKMEPCHPGKTQCRLEPVKVKECLDKYCFEITQCYKPACLPRGKSPVTKEYKPKYADKPEYADILGKLKPESSDPVKEVFERSLNDSLHIWPHCTIGKIWVGANHNYCVPLWTGTGVLVGCDLILTAGHVAPWGREGWWMRFVPAYSEGHEPFGSSYISDIRGYAPASGHNADDFVVCKLYTPLGDKCGWMGTEGWSHRTEYTGSLWNKVGYSSLFKHGEVQFFDGDEKISKVTDDGTFRLLETQGTTWGWSGGVLWGWHKDCACAIGVLCGTEEEFCIFLKPGWAGGPGMVDLVSWARTNWE